jgi:hypothetical protein
MIETSFVITITVNEKNPVIKNFYVSVLRRKCLLVTDIVPTHFVVEKYVLEEDIVLTYFIGREDRFSYSVRRKKLMK